MKSKIDYLLSSIKKGASKRMEMCPFCKTNLAHSKIIDAKYVITRLVECERCKLLVRTPTDDIEESNLFYQEEYNQGYTTDCPSAQQLSNLLESNFLESERDYSRYIRFFEFLSIPKTSRILDFGCSWGYGVYQMLKKGYHAEGFEVSLPRAQYGRDKIGVAIHSRERDLVGLYDVIFSSHVMEHLPDFEQVKSLYQNQLNAGGYFIAITPNGSRDFRKKNKKAFHQLWGKVHPVLFSDHFLKQNFNNELYYLDSWDSMTPEFKPSMIQSHLPHYELVYVLKKM